MNTLSQNKKNAETLGVFSKAIYLEADGEVFVIHDEKWGYVPFGIPVENVENYIKNGGFSVGQTVKIAVPERANMQKLPLNLPDEKRLSALEKYIAEAGSKSGILEFYQSFASTKRHIDTLFSSLISGENAAEHAVALIGLGRGLTPSGDDFLSGMFYLFFEAELCGFAIPSRIEQCAKAVFENLCRTSKISGAYLTSVLRRERFSIYENASLAALGEGDAISFADKVLPLGASSGTDTLLGSLFAAKVLMKI